ncbi:MAG: hypothetical protein ACFB8W_05595 [Elainellaceae cyanobacterium]
MTADKQAREELTNQRQHAHHVQETMSSRANDEVNQGDQSPTDEQAREGVAQERQHDSLRRQTMAERADGEK